MYKLFFISYLVINLNTFIIFGIEILKYSANRNIKIFSKQIHFYKIID